MVQPKESCTKLGKKLGVSRQRAWQIINKRNGKCDTCSLPLYSKIYCVKHLMLFREYQRKRLSYKTNKYSKYGSDAHLKELIKVQHNRRGI